MEEVKEEEGGLNKGAEHQGLNRGAEHQGLNRGSEHEVSTSPGEGYQLVLSFACLYTIG